MQTAIHIVEMALRELALGNVVMPPQSTLRLPGQDSTHRVMSAFVGGEVQALGCRALTSHSGHHSLTSSGTLLLSDPYTGEALSIMDAAFLTTMRNGATSAVATYYLARREVNEIAILGTGSQARTQLMGVCAVRNVNGALVLDPDVQARRSFANQMSKALGIPIEPVADVRAAIEMADIVITATRSREPLLRGEWLRAGAHINAVGAHLPDARELDTEAIRRAKVVTDQASACLAGAGDLILPIQEGVISAEHIHADLGQIIAGLKPGRENEEEITLFKSVGLAAQDVALGLHVYNLARQRGVGKRVNF
jgi:ornithine cyclodeaminase/alanine dehydrogenase-like protein (mu-crystallin family)